MQGRVRLTGELMVESVGGVMRAADFPGRQGRLAFACLVLARSPIAKAKIAEVVWPERLPKSWERDLSAVISKLRSALIGIGYDEPVRTAMGCYQLRLGPDTTVDMFDAARFVEDAEAALARGDLRAAHGAISVAHEHCLRPFLPGESTEWVEARRAERHLLLVRVLDAHVEINARRGAFPEGQRLALQLIDLEPYRESSYAALMRLQVAAGDRAHALKTYERARTMLAEELGVPPGTALEAAYNQALLADPPEGPSPANGAMPTGVVTVMFTDLVRSTELAQRLGPEEAESLRRSHFALLREVVAMHGGHEVKSLGDGLMVVFGLPSDALRCGAAIQKQIEQADTPERIAVRVGVHAGESVFDDGDYYGMTVVIAKRLCDANEEGGILVSDVARSLSSTSSPEARRVTLQLKGLSETTVAWQITD